MGTLLKVVPQGDGNGIYVEENDNGAVVIPPYKSLVEATVYSNVDYVETHLLFTGSGTVYKDITLTLSAYRFNNILILSSNHFESTDSFTGDFSRIEWSFNLDSVTNLLNIGDNLVFQGVLDNLVSIRKYNQSYYPEIIVNSNNKREVYFSMPGVGSYTQGDNLSFSLRAIVGVTSVR